MKTILDRCPPTPIKFIATIGVFDGVHLGHQHILRSILHKAHAAKCYPLVITFWPDPHYTLSHSFPGHILCLSAKKKIIRAMGIEHIWVLRSTCRLLAMEGKTFIQRIFNHFQIKQFVVGDDFRFGNDASMGISELTAICRQNNVSVSVIARIKKMGRIVSSSYIRTLIHAGNFTHAKKLMGREFFLSTRVIKGHGLGKKLGYPTANCEYRTFVLPKYGVYAAKVVVRGKTYLGAVSIGTNPTITTKGKLSVEVFILNFCKNIEGKPITIIFIEKLRNQKKFRSLDELRQAIGEDVAIISSRYSTFL